MTDPFLKWPGGKRWLVARHKDIFPVSYGKYIEPFLGSGAVFFYLTPSCSLLSDSNQELINCYRIVADFPDLISKILLAYQEKHTAPFYYRVRNERPVGAIERAARFIYLNRTCFNGMYRVNMKGDFNVPIGTKQSVALDSGYLQDVACRLRKSELLAVDFEVSIDRAEKGDFLFVDPPYTVMHNNNGFVKYNAKIFSWIDQVRLADAVKRASIRGAYIMLTNADHSDVRALYKDFGTHHQIARASVLSGVSSGRRATTELLLTNYSVELEPKPDTSSLVPPSAWLTTEPDLSPVVQSHLCSDYDPRAGVSRQP